MKALAGTMQLDQYPEATDARMMAAGRGVYAASTFALNGAPIRIPMRVMHITLKRAEARAPVAFRVRRFSWAPDPYFTLNLFAQAGGIKSKITIKIKRGGAA